jgi:DNA-binding MarR family transcriptional regulator
MAAVRFCAATGMMMDIKCNCLSLRQATRRVTQLYDHAMADLDLRATQFQLLAMCKMHGPVTLNVLAELMVMDRATIGHNLRPLKARGLIRIAVGQDRRSREVSVTKSGQALLTRGLAIWRKVQHAFEKEFGEDQAAALRKTLQRISMMEFPYPG